jgi:DNA-binding transcriptional ArsR family regulator
MICTMTQTRKQSEQTDLPRSCCPDLAALIDPSLFKALSDPSRVALLARLGRAGRPTTVTEAASCCPVDVSVVSRHLTVLRRAGVVESAKTGREVRYTLSPSAAAATLRSLADALEACCPPPPPTSTDTPAREADTREAADPPVRPPEV